MARNIFKEIERRVMNEQMDETTRQKLLGNLLRMQEWGKVVLLMRCLEKK